MRDRAIATRKQFVEQHLQISRPYPFSEGLRALGKSSDDPQTRILIGRGSLSINSDSPTTGTLTNHGSVAVIFTPASLGGRNLSLAVTFPANIVIRWSYQDNTLRLVFVIPIPIRISGDPQVAGGLMEPAQELLSFEASDDTLVYTSRDEGDDTSRNVIALQLAKPASLSRGRRTSLTLSHRLSALFVDIPCTILGGTASEDGYYAIKDITGCYTSFLKSGTHVECANLIGPFKTQEEANKRCK